MSHDQRCRDLTDVFVDGENLPPGAGEALAEHIQSAIEDWLRDARATPPLSPVGPSPRTCTCLGSCKGPEGLAPGWVCAMGRSAPATPVAPLSEPMPAKPCVFSSECINEKDCYAVGRCMRATPAALAGEPGKETP